MLDAINDQDCSQYYLEPITEQALTNARSIEEMKTDISSVLDMVDKNKNLDRYTICKILSPIYVLGTNPLTNSPVYVMNKDISYFIHKHYGEGSLKKEDLLAIDNIFNYDAVFKDSGGLEGGFAFYKKSTIRDGYLEGAIKMLNNGEELFHYQYKRASTSQKLMKKLEEMGLLVDKKI